MTDQVPFIEVRHLSKYFFGRKELFRKETRAVKAVDGVQFSIPQCQTLGVVGESGCGKSTLGRAILRLHEPTSGQVFYEGKNLLEYDKEQMRNLRKELQIIFQDPYSSLNPRMTVKELIQSPLDVFSIGTRKERQERVAELMEKVGLPLEFMNRYPHEFSGGQRQRIVIARALVLNPKFVVCDEPVSALDVSVRAQVLNLMKDLQRELNLTYLFISHDLSVVRYICDRIMVMYLGKVMEIADKKDLYENPCHPYTKALMSAIPIPDMDVEYHKIHLEGDVPSPFHPPSGCRFHTRCRYATEKCKACVPELKDVGCGHMVACHLFEEA